MVQPLRLGVVGLSHDHIWDHLPQIQASKSVELVIGCDMHEELCDRFEKETGCPTTDDLDSVLDETRVDGIFVYCSNAEGAQVATTAAERGLHVLVEKPMAADLAGADQMLAAARRNKTQLVINWPFAWWPQLQHAVDLAKSGVIGDIWQVKYRAAHAGPQELGCSDYFCDWLFDPSLNGGGAMMDYCCYGCVLASTLLGTPSRVTGIAGRYLKENITVEDNALVAMEYPRGLATAEASWTQIGKLTAYTTAIYGSTGTLTLEPREDGKLFLATVDDPEGSEVAVPAVPLHRTNAAEYFAHCVATGGQDWALCNDRIARDAQEILDAGFVSASENKAITLPLPVTG